MTLSRQQPAVTAKARDTLRYSEVGAPSWHTGSERPAALPSAQSAGRLHTREPGAQIWGLKQATYFLRFLICKMEIIVPASWS